MSQDLLVPMMLALTVLVIVALLVLLIVRPKGWGNFASLTAFHDFQRKDKQDAIEIAIEREAGKKMEEEESGEGN